MVLDIYSILPTQPSWWFTEPLIKSPIKGKEHVSNIWLMGWQSIHSYNDVTVNRWFFTDEVTILTVLIRRNSLSNQIKLLQHQRVCLINKKRLFYALFGDTLQNSTLHFYYQLQQLSWISSNRKKKSTFRGKKTTEAGS